MKEEEYYRVRNEDEYKYENEGENEESGRVE